jgi:hypothetical protein
MEGISGHVVSGYHFNNKRVGVEGFPYQMEAQVQNKVLSRKTVNNNPVEVPGVYLNPAPINNNNPIRVPDISLQGNVQLKGEAGVKHPLVFVDAVLRDMDYLNKINPAEIIKIDVFKDDKAMELYGADGANGVIFAVTKKGAANNGQPDLVLTKDLSNSTLWVGIDNPVKLTAVRDWSTVSVSIINGSISGNKGDYLVRVTKLGTATIQVHLGEKIYNFNFNVRAFPKPDASFNGK